MNKLTTLILGILCVLNYKSQAQNIGGVVNHYAAVTNIAASNISVVSATAFSTGDRILLVQMKGASVTQGNVSAFGDITSLGGAGTYEFSTVQSVNGNVIAASALTNTYNTSSGYVQVVRVPRFCTPNVTSSLTCAQWNSTTKTGGILAFEAGTLTLNADIDASAKGFNGGNFATGTFGCDNGNYTGIGGLDGGQKGESISAYISGSDGLKGKQANGGGGANSGNSGGGGGGNFGTGGFGGNQYSDCGSYDDRGLGALDLPAGFPMLFMGGGGGGGFMDNNMIATKGGNGGGIIYIKANQVISNNHVIASNGGSVTIVADAEGAGGGGAGGTVFLECNNISGNLAVKTDGGSGGSNNNTAFLVFCHGPGGGGGGGVFAFSQPALPGGITYSSLGGMPGIVENSVSVCYNTSNGATAGSSGTLLPGLPTTPLVLTIPVLGITQANTIICSGESTSLSVSGAATYSWSTGSTNTTIAVSPTLTSSYTVSGTGAGANTCATALTATVEVSPCTGINGLGISNNTVKIYPNPTSGKLVVETAATVQLIICDEMGRVLLDRTFQKGEQSLDVSNYAAGVYFIKEMSTAGARVTKLVKTN